MNRDEVAKTFAALKAHREASQETIADLFRVDPNRFENFHIKLDDVLFDYSKHRVTRTTLDLLFALARAAGVEDRRSQLFDGAAVNITEHRPALHMALRKLDGAPVLAEGKDVMPEVLAERQKIFTFAEAIRKGTIKAANGERFTDIVNIGIGGSDLGPRMVVTALAPFVADHLTMHFVSNVDGADLGDTLKKLPLATTLFIVCSKTFTTLETMTNAQTAREAVAEKLGEAAVADHFCAVSTQLDKIAAFGIKSDRVFGFWDWVGGRYSVWSAIGLSVVIAIGAEKFEKFLLGGQDIDQHFQTAPLESNVPVIMALLEIWYRDLWDYATRAVIPYDERMHRFSAYLQQLEMESNGKSVQLSGAPVTESTSPVVWGEPGTNGQHAFFQMLHQGTEIVPIDFLVAAQPSGADAKHHQLLVANCLAQSQALMQGRSLEDVKTLLTAQGLDTAAVNTLAPHKVFPGNRPSSTFLYKRLSPRVLGQLIALYEHKVFVEGVIWNVDSFDQWGVELGKELANKLTPIIRDSEASLEGLDGSTAGLIGEIRKHKKG
ncbi:glucose-6-phosphate isomerase [Beijerinckia indica]|uniref:Glucose-6-phosphate isomerase n=1 Tax=Beijerinckia indica subsp. indica (strain ATCC 9039 / DSM 1715 / NCIMB 8712) TaxID=395963 RepID=G6PI_BEII9|nr:glucose-6-phosphate isomerase [Beijerinckia indica]B2IJT2.1 RecName: Full=Glucose-6-phosphate isomerase; Short=GPI; AltName: Full=Phosphoglucose isomerase; Short=PGI; AltName: Full=Phosphohexose isomerase; Short=PHI [Beijerinckia indica subsp. indica ATCC 9039]ACB96307.1 Glucose-6-phosphate isomerase [Beijerinckia indica subsp. indica ATCC 9039]